MNLKRLVILLIMFPIVCFSQTRELSIFDDLIGKTWFAEGKWGDGSLFKQEVSYSYDLEKTLVVTEAKGFINKEQTKFGNRNHGIRQYNSVNKEIVFWEFDVFGGVTKGTVTAGGKNIMYTYNYGDSVVTDLWEYIDNETYRFVVGSYKNNKWEQIYLDTVFRLKK
ncbi:hypothetical protein [Winogradskyella immobilis]|uniref:DUF1579 domain-containing protein n=1 Tax=Winogradskyella immobilis TaxID=2816852 RepID=A0ABS8EJP0_9FLAO|nr:hypothetical protein [Winogradskyella immobilis]MCC1483272.1 hypothetical protein [Winogradskyella immobilis]MCG0015366.1 hypothetical protein [Winogradskyella immobilis]